MNFQFLVSPIQRQPLPVFVTALFLGSLLTGILSLSSSSCAQESPSSGDLSIRSLEIGIGNHIVLGHWHPILIEFDSPLSSDTKFLGVSTLDGSGIRQRYEFEVTPGAERFDGLIRIGKANGGITISSLDDERKTLNSSFFDSATISDRHTIHQSVRPLYLNLGTDIDLAKNLGLDRTLAKKIEEVESVYLSDASLLPSHPTGYDSIDTIIFTTFGEARSFVEQMSGDQISAIRKWVEFGGRLIIGSGQNANQLLGQGQSLEPLAISNITGSVPIENTGRIESFVRSRNQLVQRGDEPIMAAESSGQGSVVLLRDRNGPVISKRAVGFGQIVFVAIDLDDPRVLEWSEFPRLLQNILSFETDAASANQSDSRSGRVTHIGFEEISGQLRSSLDQFENVRVINFTVVALLTGLFILLIGPADYFLLSRVFKRMEWTWLTFSLCTLGFCGLAIWLQTSTKPQTTQINQVDVVDFDEASNLIRGFVRSHVYSPRSAKHDISLVVEQPGVAAENSNWISWQGLPGKGLGGMQNEARWQGAEYQAPTMSDSTQLRSHLHSFPVQNASTSSLAAAWNGTSNLKPNSRLFQDENGSDLNGTFTNPFEFQLSGPVIFHNETAYVFRRSIKPGETVSVETDSERRSIRSFFTNTRGAQKTKRRWDVLSLDTPRIAEMMMFFDVAGGQSYTTLSNEYSDELDLSHLLTLDRAILIARTKQVFNTIELGNQTSPETRDQQWTFLRIVMPVGTRE